MRLPETHLELGKLGECGDVEGCLCSRCCRSLPPVSPEKVRHGSTRRKLLISHSAPQAFHAVVEAAQNMREQWKEKPPTAKATNPRQLCLC